MPPRTVTAAIVAVARDDLKGGPAAVRWLPPAHFPPHELGVLGEGQRFAPLGRLIQMPQAARSAKMKRDRECSGKVPSPANGQRWGGPLDRRRGGRRRRQPGRTGW
ncbi:hypothetical protein San01_13450 [Streptomyces angustmyceticus]|uniref:Uncharacterized protein n=1 Tax=Streptomyces angustmyceticus TaxID=285578 RepID=A0A5J4LDY4_9ACTN|nr:hypothetical protein San01_13450 [Streptomyces angustmyceticus]